MTHLTLTVAQLNPIVGDLPYNLDKMRKVRDEAPPGTDLVVYPEMIVCGYPPEDLTLKPFFLDQVQSAVEALVKESEKGGPALLVSAPWRVSGAVHNAALLIENGVIAAIRPKHHLPTYGVFDENRIFAPGPLPAPIPFKGAQLGVMTCEDMWYPDVAAHLKQQGADGFIVLNASPYECDKNHLRREQARARVTENALPLLYVNQVGGQDELVFDGGSFALDAAGTVVMQLPACEETEERGKIEEGRFSFLPSSIFPLSSSSLPSSISPPSLSACATT